MKKSTLIKKVWDEAWSNANTECTSFTSKCIWEDSVAYKHYLKALEEELHNG